MRKIVLSLAISCALLSMMGIVAVSVVNPDLYRRADQTDPSTLERVIVTLLIPQIQKAADEFYEPYLSISTAAVAYFAQARVMELHESKSHSRYVISLEIEPFFGPHISVGRDRLTFEVDAAGKVRLKEFQHLQSYDIPPHYQSVVKRPLP